MISRGVGFRYGVVGCIRAYISSITFYICYRQSLKIFIAGSSSKKFIMTSCEAPESKKSLISIFNL